ncbi:hypothetical protein [Pseudoalteromonas sp. A757]|uniref:hypothetical protein n=1 Tax=Pseudoalteromonas sp. A757 TaxID=2250709 RepID=UPI001F00E442|nr:hypothetical protein [Pseudoalteromonas sp. A757]
MLKELKPASMKVQEFLSKNGQDFVVQEMPSSTRTASDAAASIGCSVAQIAKSLIFKHGETGEAVLYSLSLLVLTWYALTKLKKRQVLHLPKLMRILYVKKLVM